AGKLGCSSAALWLRTSLPGRGASAAGRIAATWAAWTAKSTATATATAEAASQHGRANTRVFQLVALLRFESGRDNRKSLGAQGRDFYLDFRDTFRFFTHDLLVVLLGQ